MVVPLCLCGCGNPVEKRDYETASQWRKREAKGIYRDKCAKNLPPPIRDRPHSTLSLLHPPNYKVEDKEPNWKETPEVDPKYEAWIREQPCLIPGCFCSPVQSHHQNRRKHGGKSTKCSSYRCLPLCPYHHTGGGTDVLSGSYHGLAGLTGWKFWEYYRVDVESTINRLNQEYNEMLSRKG